MSEEKLKSAILGLNEEGLGLLSAIDSAGVFDIVAVGDSQTKLAEKTAQRHNCAFFDDYRTQKDKAKDVIALSLEKLEINLRMRKAV